MNQPLKTPRVVLCRSLDELTPLRAEWSELAENVPFCSPEWLESAWQAYAAHDPQAELFVLAVLDSHDRLMGLAPWHRQKTRLGGWRILPLGSGEICSEYVSLLTHSGEESSVATAIAHWLLKTASQSPTTQWNQLDVGDVFPNDHTTRQLLSLLECAGQHLVCRRGTRCWQIQLPATWDEYLAMLSKSHRKQVRQATQRVLESGRVTLHTAQTEAELKRGMEVLTALHQQRNTQRGAPGCFASPAFEHFIRTFAQRWLPTGKLRLSWLEMSGRPIAAEYQFIGGDTLFAYQSGIDNETLDLEPGRLIMIATFRQAMQEGIRCLDFLRGDEWYKIHWRAEPHCATRVCVYRRGLVTGLAAVGSRLVSRAKQTLRPWVRGRSIYPCANHLRDLDSLKTPHNGTGTLLLETAYAGE
jgi:CelD/BcsL family acetyltransferase involved in cellulose biosynthesis